MDRIRNKRWLLKIKASVLSIFLGIIFFSVNANALNRQSLLPTHQFMINGTIVQLEIAQTRLQLKIGLMGRSLMPRNKGMLFVFPQFRRHGIWMKNMLIPLTVAWLDKQLKVIAVKKLMPCRARNCSISKPPIASAYVVELNVDHQLSIGDQFKVVSNTDRFK